LVLRRALQFALGVAALPRIVSAAAAQSCVDPQSESLRASLHYASVSTVANQSCSGCGFFTRDSAKAGCGTCVMMSGPVDETGRCDSWSARS
jgi:High potential iron-sulfur protein